MKFQYLWHTQSFLKMHELVPSESKGLNFYMSIHLNPYFVCAGSKGSGETAQTGLSLVCSPMSLHRVATQYPFQNSLTFH